MIERCSNYRTCIFSAQSRKHSFPSSLTVCHTHSRHRTKTHRVKTPPATLLPDCRIHTTRIATSAFRISSPSPSSEVHLSAPTPHARIQRIGPAHQTRSCSNHLWNASGYVHRDLDVLPWLTLPGDKHFILISSCFCSCAIEIGIVLASAVWNVREGPWTSQGRRRLQWRTSRAPEGSYVVYLTLGAMIRLIHCDGIVEAVDSFAARITAFDYTSLPALLPSAIVTMVVLL